MIGLAKSPSDSPAIGPAIGGVNVALRVPKWLNLL